MHTGTYIEYLAIQLHREKLAEAEHSRLLRLAEQNKPWTRRKRRPLMLLYRLAPVARA